MDVSSCDESGLCERAANEETVTTGNSQWYDCVAGMLSLLGRTWKGKEGPG